nr:aldehyde dehydrogenase family protein [Acidithiobacillus ferriphilus]
MSRKRTLFGRYSATSRLPSIAHYLWTRDLGRAYRVAEATQCGIVGVNDGSPATPQAPFGGNKL